MAGAQSPGSLALAARLRPVMGGFSIGHKDITAGTIATAAYDILPGGSSNPPSTGIGDPSQFYLSGGSVEVRETEVLPTPG